jgi:cytochrome c556
MRKTVLIAVATVSLLGACRQAEQTNEAANERATAESGGNVAAPAAATVSAEEAQKIFHERHEGMEEIGKSTKAVSQALKADTPDLEVIRKSAATINDLAAKSGTWFPAGTGQDVLPKTRALPPIWQKPEDFAAKDRDFEASARAFNAAAVSGDMSAIRSSFDTLGKSCKACHDTYRAEHHPK